MEQKSHEKISPWTAEFTAPDLEQRFRNAAMPEWRVQIRLFSIFLGTGIVAGTLPFLVLNTRSEDYAAVILLRAVMAVAMFTPAFLVWRKANYRTMDSVLSASLVFVVTVGVVQMYLSSSNLEILSIPVIVFTLFVYLAFPNRTWLTVGVGVWIVIVFLGAWSSIPDATDVVPRTVVLLITANAAGFAIRGRLQKIERRQFVSVEALEDGQTRLQTMFQLAPDGIITIDPQGTIQSMNQAFLDLFGYPEAEIIGRSILELAPPDWHQNLQQLLKEMRAGSGNLERTAFEAEGLRRDGSTFPFEFSVASMVLPRERLVVAFVRDLTELKRLDQIQSEFISTVSHELRTPLTSIKGSLGLVRAGAFGDAGKKVGPLIDIAYNNSDRLVRLINDILDLDKIQTGMMEFRMELLDLGEVVKQAVLANQGLGDQHGVSISLADPTHSTQIRGDHDRLSQVMANLLSNATKFSPEGGSVEVSITSNGSFVRVAVADYGPGIPQESRDTIFDRFTQAHQTDSSRIGGTGLGLSICKSIIEHHAGTIGFETEDGSGSTFYFELPNRKDQSVRSG